MGISLKENLIAQLEFALVYYDVAVQHISHYTTGIPSTPNFGLVC